MNSSLPDSDIHMKLVDMLRGANAQFRVIEHVAEGRSDEVALIRGNRMEQGAKAMIFKISYHGGGHKFALAIVPSHRRVSSDLVVRQMQGKRGRLAELADAERLAGCPIGAIPPFSFSPDLVLLVDKSLLDEEEIVFNAGRLDRSIFLRVADYKRIACPVVCAIAE